MCNGWDPAVEYSEYSQFLYFVDFKQPPDVLQTPVSPRM